MVWEARQSFSISLKTNVHGVWLAQGGRKRLKKIGIQLIINLNKHGTNLTSTTLGRCFNFSYCKLGNKKKGAILKL